MYSCPLQQEQGSIRFSTEPVFSITSYPASFVRPVGIPKGRSHPEIHSVPIRYIVISRLYPVGPVGLIFSIANIKSRSLVPSILCHSTFLYHDRSATTHGCDIMCFLIAEHRNSIALVHGTNSKNFCACVLRIRFARYCS